MQTTKNRTVPIADNGRMNLPSDMRRALGLSGAGHLILTLDGDAIRITTAKQAVRRVHALAAPYRPSGERASDALIAERREEARREDDEISGADRG